jgi:hypothetical protein
MAINPISSVSSLASGIGAILGRTMFLQTISSTGIPVPLCVLDVVENEDVEYRAEVSEHPVEVGPEVGDHRQLKNPTVRLKGKISSTPLDLSVAIANIATSGIAAITDSQARSNLLNSGLSQGVGLAGAALQGKSGNIGAAAFTGAVDATSRTIMIYCYTNNTPFSVLTKRQRFDNCVIERLRFPRDLETGFALEFEIDIKQIKLVKSTTVQKTQLDESVISGGASVSNLGSQSTSAATPQVSSAVGSSSLSSAPGVSSKFGAA